MSFELVFQESASTDMEWIAAGMNDCEPDLESPKQFRLG